MPYSFSIINQKGGVGKTTSTINLGACLAKRGLNILIIDLDPQGNTTHTLLPEIDQDILIGTYDFINNQITKTHKPFTDYIQKATFTSFENTVDVMPANIKLSEIEIQLTQEMSRERKMTQSFKHFEKELDRYDLILIDCPPSLGLLTINAFVASTFLLVPVDASAYSFQGLVELIESLGKCNETFDCETTLFGIFFSTFSQNELVYKESYQMLQNQDKARLFETVIRKSTKLQQAPYYNQSIVDYAPESGAYQDYELLTTEFLDRLKAFHDNQPVHVQEVTA